MQRRLTIVLASALLMATAASFIVYRLAGTPRSASGVFPPFASWLQPAILKRVRLSTEGDLGLVDWPAPPGPGGTILSRNKAIDRGVISAIYQGEPVTEYRLAPAGSGGRPGRHYPPPE